jgi:hypothetical protein
MSEESLIEEKDKAIENWETMYKSVVQTCYNDKEEIERLNKQILDLQQEQIAEMQEHQEAMQVADKTIKSLEDKLAESESRFQAHKQNDARIIQDQTDLIENLKQQLAEWQDGTIVCKWTDAENKVKELEQQLSEKEELIMFADRTIKGLVLAKEIDKISFAVEQLEKVKELVDLEYGHINIIDTIDNQIKQLKEQKL